MNKKNVEYRNYVVAFIDILGQRDAFKPLEEFEIIENKEDLKEKLKKVHIDTTYQIKNLRDSFVDFFTAFTEERPIKYDIPADKIDIFKEMRKAVLKYKCFSDCMQVFTSLGTEKYHSVAINSVFGLLSSCGAMFMLTLAEKKVFRAGIDIGIGIEIDENEIYGPALFRAYDLESEIAQYPRIVVGDTLISYLLNLSNKIPQIKNQIEPDIKLCKSMADNCLKMLAIDIDGYTILNYLGEEFIKGAKASLGNRFQDIFDVALSFVTSKHKELMEIKDSKLAQRYYLLAQYFFRNKKHICK